MKIIPVKMPNKDAYYDCLVDESDFGILGKYKWSLTGSGYPRTGFTNRTLYPDKKSVTAMMHKVILWCPKGMIIDHINGDKLDNRKENLRICTPAQSVCNIGARKDSESGIKGVTWSKYRKRWFVQIRSNYKMHYGGCFIELQDALDRHKVLAKKIQGDFAYKKHYTEDSYKKAKAIADNVNASG